MKAKRLLSMLLAVCLLFGSLAVPALAEERLPEQLPTIDETAPAEETQETAGDETTATEETQEPTVEETTAAEEVPETIPLPTEEELPMDGDTPDGAVPTGGFNGVWFQGYVYRVKPHSPMYEYTYTLQDGTHKLRFDHFSVMRLKVDGKYKTAYCLEPGLPVNPGADYGNGSGLGINDEWNLHLTWEQQRAIGLTLLYSSIHHPGDLNSAESVEWEVATQIIIWEIVMGMRNAAHPYNCTNTSLVNEFDGRIRYQSGNKSQYLTGMKDKYDRISHDLAQHALRPSFTGRFLTTAPTHMMELGSDGSYSVTLTDSNGVLPSYAYSSQSPVTISQSGNTLTATAPAGSSWGELSFAASKNIPNPDNPACLFRVFNLSGNNQDLVMYADNMPYDPVPAYFKLQPAIKPGTAAIVKTSDQSVEGYCFKLYNWETYRSWYGKTDGDGNMYETDSSYNAQTGTYEFTGLMDGIYTVKEALSVHGAGAVFPTSWRITVVNADGDTTYDRTFSGSEIQAEDSGDAKLYDPKLHLTGLSGGGKLTMTIHNASLNGFIEVNKKDDAGNPVSGAEFTLTNTATGATYPLGPTNTSGYAITAEVPLGTYQIEETTVPEGYVAGSIPDTVTLTADAPNRTVSFEAVNPRLRGHVQLRKVESGTDVNLAGAEFEFKDPAGNVIGTYTTDNQGLIEVRDLLYGYGYSYRETKAPDGYVIDPTVHTFDVTDADMTYTYTHENPPRPGSISIRKVDTQGNPMEGVTFRLDYSTDDGTTWLPVRSRGADDLLEAGTSSTQGIVDGQLSTDAEGKITFEGLRIDSQSGNIRYRLTEIATRNGSTLLIGTAFDGHLAEDDQVDITLTAVNSRAFEMPVSGGWTQLISVVGVILLGAAIIWIVRDRNKNEKKKGNHNEEHD